MKAIKKFKSNRIRERITELAITRMKDASFLDVEQEKIKQQIKTVLKITPNQLTLFLKNHHNQPSTGQIFEIAQILECPIEDLIECGKNKIHFVSSQSIHARKISN